MDKVYHNEVGVLPLESKHELIDCVDNSKSVFWSLILCNKKTRNNLIICYEVQGN